MYVHLTVQYLGDAGISLFLTFKPLTRLKVQDCSFTSLLILFCVIRWIKKTKADSSPTPARAIFTPKPRNRKRKYVCVSSHLISFADLAWKTGVRGENQRNWKAERHAQVKEIVRTGSKWGQIDERQDNRSAVRERERALQSFPPSLPGTERLRERERKGKEIWRGRRKTGS